MENGKWKIFGNGEWKISIPGEWKINGMENVKFPNSLLLN